MSTNIPSAGRSVGATLWPIVQNWRETPKDDFPLSYYPMFTAKRGKLTRVTYLVGIDSEGQRHLLPYTLVGTGGLNQVRRQINRAVREGRENELARTVAANIAIAAEPGLEEISAVIERLLSGELHDLLDREVVCDIRYRREHVFANEDARVIA